MVQLYRLERRGESGGALVVCKRCAKLVQTESAVENLTLLDVAAEELVAELSVVWMQLALLAFGFVVVKETK